MPIDGHFVIDPRDAAYATREMLKPKFAHPVRYRTIPGSRGHAAGIPRRAGPTREGLRRRPGRQARVLRAHGQIAPDHRVIARTPRKSRPQQAIRSPALSTRPPTGTLDSARRPVLCGLLHRAPPNQQIIHRGTTSTAPAPAPRRREPHARPRLRPLVSANRRCNETSLSPQACACSTSRNRHKLVARGADQESSANSAPHSRHASRAGGVLSSAPRGASTTRSLQGRGRGLPFHAAAFDMLTIGFTPGRVPGVGAPSTSPGAC